MLICFHAYMFMDLHHILEIISGFIIHTAHAATAAAPAVLEQAAEAAPHTAAKQESILTTLGINWKLLIAQVINFGIIFFVLWKYAFTPVAKKLQERTDRIEKSVHDAGRIEHEKQEFEVWKNEAMKNARAQASAIVTEAKTEAEKNREEITAQTKADQQKLVEQAKAQIEAEKITALQSAKSELADIITNATEKILRGKLDEKKDADLIKESLKEIK